MSQLRFGIVGTGMIAGVIADAIDAAENATLVAVASRKLETAKAFAEKRSGVAAAQGVEGLLALEDVDAVYIATPTAAKEEIALTALAAGKHVLIEKPFLSFDSVLRMTEAAASNGVAFMDATHFVHHPRTEAVRQARAERIGTAQSLNTTFYFPFADRGNIRFDVKREPMGAIGDLAWYAMRAVVEYLQPKGEIAKVYVIPERDKGTTTVVRASGLLSFESGEVSTFAIGYTAGVALMELELLGTSGVIAMDDFVLDWNNSFAFQNPEIAAGFTHRTGLATRKDVTFVPTPAKRPAQVAMIEDFAKLAFSGDKDLRSASAAVSLKTQQYLDAVWAAARA